MTIISGDTVAMATGGVLESRATGSKPTTPTLSIVTGTGQVTATIDGDSGVTNYLRYKAPSDTSWRDGGSRSGDGDLVVTGLSSDVPYVFVAYSIDDDNVASLPSVACLATLSETATEGEFDDLLVDTTDEFLETFGEDIKYLPAGGGQREIVAIVDRGQPAPLDGAPHGHSPLLTISVANDSTTGISSSEIDTGGDKVELAVRIGETVQQRRITKVLSQDAGMMKLEIR